VLLSAQWNLRNLSSDWLAPSDEHSGFHMVIGRQLGETVFSGTLQFCEDLSGKIRPALLSIPQQADRPDLRRTVANLVYKSLLRQDAISTAYLPA